MYGNKRRCDIFFCHYFFLLFTLPFFSPMMSDNNDSTPYSGRTLTSPCYEAPTSPYHEAPTSPHYDIPSPSSGWAPTSPHFDIPSPGSGWAPTYPYYDIPSPSYGWAPTSPHFDIPLPSYEWAPTSPHFDIPLPSYEWAPTSPYCGSPSPWQSLATADAASKPKALFKPRVQQNALAAAPKRKIEVCKSMPSCTPRKRIVLKNRK